MRAAFQLSDFEGFCDLRHFRPSVSKTYIPTYLLLSYVDRIDVRWPTVKFERRRHFEF